MAYPYRRVFLSLLVLQIVFIAFAVSPSVANRTIQIAATPQSGIAPLEVKILCVVASNTTAPESYTMDFGDGSEPERVDSTSYSHTFTHIYQGGYYKPICTVEKSAGLTTQSDPGRVIVARWKFETRGDVDSSPAVGPDGTVYVGSDDGNLYAVDPATGTELWRMPLGAEVRSSPAVSEDGTIYVGAGNSLYALKYNGTLKWSFNAGDYIFSSPAVSADGRVVYIGSSNGSLYAINATGAFKWQFQAGDKIISSPSIGYDGTETVVYVGSIDRHLYAVAADNGVLKWKFQTNAEVYGSPAVGADGTVYVGECKTGSAESYDFKFFCLNVDGSKRWEFYGGTGFYSSPAIDGDGKIYVGAWDGYLYALNPDGNRSWSVRTSPPSDINSSPSVGGNGMIYAGCKNGNFYAFQSSAVDEEGKKQDWVFQTKDIIQSSPVIDGEGTIYFGSRDNCLYAINPGNLAPADSSWPMFRKNAAHTGASGEISVPVVISASPERNSTGVNINTATIQVNFSPLVETSQVDIDSFTLEKETDSGKEPVEGFAVLDYERYNTTGYHIVAVYERLDNDVPLPYNTKFYATIRYAENPPTEEEETGTLGPDFYDKTFSWAFTTETEPEEETGSGSGGSPGCFIGVIAD